LKLVSL